jgi:hypothetical protein
MHHGHGNLHAPTSRLASSPFAFWVEPDPALEIVAETETCRATTYIPTRGTSSAAETAPAPACQLGACEKMQSHTDWTCVSSVISSSLCSSHVRSSSLLHMGHHSRSWLMPSQTQRRLMTEPCARTTQSHCTPWGPRLPVPANSRSARSRQSLARCTLSARSWTGQTRVVELRRREIGACRWARRHAPLPVQAGPRAPVRPSRE